MNHNDPLLNEVAELLAHSLEGDLQEDQFVYFRNLLQSDPLARAYYYRLLSIQATLQEAESVLALQDDPREVDYHEALNALSIEEKTAPAIDIPRLTEIDAVLPMLHYPKVPRKISRFSIVTLVISAAAVMLIAALLRFGPAPRIEVATITNSVDALFAGSQSSDIGSRLTSGSGSLWLQEGVIEVTFDYGATVTLEAPAQVTINSVENISLHSGRLYAHVPERSKGFMVETPSSRVIDLGTEFGVKVDFDGSSDVYMMKGKASIFSGSKGQTGQGQILSAGDARRIDSSGCINPIPMREDVFARDILMNGGLIWRGQDVDLADIVGGGNGFGGGRIEHSIDPTTGEMIPWKIPVERSGTGRFIPVNVNAFIDGVFVPDGGEGPVQVTSSGLQWQSPDTTNNLKYNIANSLHIPEDWADFEDYAGIPKEDAILNRASKRNVPLRLMGLMGSHTPPGESDSSLFMHANTGITFDLDQVRNVLPKRRVVTFKSVFGIAEIIEASARLDVWVLVNGQVRYSRQNVTGEVIADIDVELSSDDRFLTLVVTDGEDQGDYGYDWGLFMNPQLEVK